MKTIEKIKKLELKIARLEGENETLKEYNKILTDKMTNSNIKHVVSNRIQRLPPMYPFGEI